MKKTGIIAVLLVAGATCAFAAGSRETVTVEGKLSVTDSVPTIASGGKIYELPVGPFYRIAWEKSVKAGDTLKVEGVAVENPGRRSPAAVSGNAPSGTSTDSSDAADRIVLMPSKLWVNGKEVDLSSYATGPGAMGAGRMGGGRFADACADCGAGMMGGQGISGRGPAGRGSAVPGVAGPGAAGRGTGNRW